LTKQTEEVAAKQLVDGSEITLHSHAGGGGGGPAEKGVATTGADGTIIVNFSGSYNSKPVVSLTPEFSHGADVVTVQIEAWVGSQPPYTGMTIFCGDDGGKPEEGVPVHWAIWS